MWIVIALLGLAGGLVSTLFGFGGGMILAIALALTVSPLAALAVASLALLTGSIHRVVLFKHGLRLGDAHRWGLGIAVGSILGGMLAHHVPDYMLRAAFVVAAALALLPRRDPSTAPRAHTSLLVPAGGAIGFIGAGTAGVGPLASSTLVATGHVGDRYIALMSLTGVALNLGRIVGYGASGALEVGLLWASSSAAVGLFAGNALGKRVRHHVDPRHVERFERIIPWACLGLALLGLLRGS